MGKRKAMERDVLPLPLPSPPAPTARVTRRRLGTSQGGGGRCILQMPLMDFRRSQPQFQESDTLKNSFEPGFDYALYNVVIKPE